MMMHKKLSKHIPVKYIEACNYVLNGLKYVKEIQKIQWWYRDVTRHNIRYKRARNYLLRILEQMNDI